MPKQTWTIQRRLTPSLTRSVSPLECVNVVRRPPHCDGAFVSCPCVILCRPVVSPCPVIRFWAQGVCIVPCWVALSLSVPAQSLSLDADRAAKHRPNCLVCFGLGPSALCFSWAR
jgi:hypothetical protein